MILAFLGLIPTPWPSCGQTSPVEPAPSFHVVTHVGERDRRFGACQADSPDHQPHRPFEMGERMLDTGSD